MLYLTTRNKADSYTAYRMLRCEYAPDGGQFLPMRLPVLSDFQLAEFEQMNFGQITAAILNLFFGTKITGWDVDFAVGRQAVTMATAGYKVSVAETWHNPSGTHEYLVKRLYALVCGDKNTIAKPNLWFETVVDISLLFTMHAYLCRQDIYEFDIALESGDLQQLFALRYAQKMGLPVGKIILGSIENDGLWEFLSHGEYATSSKVHATGLEALLWQEFGYDETARFLSAKQRKAIYHLDVARVDVLRKEMFTSVVGQNRAMYVAKSATSSGQYSMELSTARAFGALQDYRAKTGINRNTLLISRNAPRMTK